TLDDIDRELAEVTVELQQQLIAQEFDLNNRIIELMVGTRAGLGQIQKVPSTGSILLGGLVQGGLSAGSAYAAKAFYFGSFR
ncbi:MAG: virion core protein, T7 gp14 family, partial [Bacillati bacterium]